MKFKTETATNAYTELRGEVEKNIETMKAVIADCDLPLEKISAMAAIFGERMRQLSTAMEAASKIDTNERMLAFQCGSIANEMAKNGD